MRSLVSFALAAAKNPSKHVSICSSSCQPKDFRSAALSSYDSSQFLSSFRHSNSCPRPFFNSFRTGTRHEIQNNLIIKPNICADGVNVRETASYLKAAFHGRRSFSSWTDQFHKTRRLLVPDVEGMVLGLIAVNAGVLFLWKIWAPSFMLDNFTVSLANLEDGRVHTLLTPAFSHMDPLHFIQNMIGLYFFGTPMGQMLGPQFLLKLYLLGGALGSIFFLLHDAYRRVSSKESFRSKTFALGASASVNAIIMLQIFLFPRSVHYVNFLIPVPAALVGAFLIAMDIWRTMEYGSHISGAAHLGGVVVAALMWARIRGYLR